MHEADKKNKPKRFRRVSGRMIYLDNAATGRYKPKTVFEAMMAALQTPANPGRGGHLASIKAAGEVERARDCIKRTFNATNCQVIFTCNCTEALNIAILGWLRKFKGQESRVICTAYDHNSVLRPLTALKGEQDLTVDVVMPDDNGEISVRAIREKITDKTRLIIATHISNVTGGVTDINAVGALCKQYNIPFLADCAQSAGHLKIDMQAVGMTFLCTAGHKGLHGPQGSGFLIVKEGTELLPVKFGGTGTESLSISQPSEMPESLESGTLNTPGICGLRAGIEWTHANLLEINSRIKAFCAVLRDRLERISRVKLYSPPGSGLVTFSVDGMTSVDVADELNEAEIFVRGGLHCAPLAHIALNTVKDGLVRISPGWSNTERQAEITASVIKNIAK